MKALDVLGTGVRKAAAAVGTLIAGGPKPPVRSSDPFYNDLERRAQVNDGSRHGLARWLGPRRGGWLR